MTTTMSFASIKKAMITLNNSYTKMSKITVDTSTEKGKKTVLRMDSILIAIENLSLGLKKNGYVNVVPATGTVVGTFEDIYRSAESRLLSKDCSKEYEGMPILSTEREVFDFMYSIKMQMTSSESALYRFWIKTGRALSLSWFYTGRYIVKGVVYVWDKICDLWTWIKSKFTKKAAPTTVATTPQEAAPVASEEVVESAATPVATPVIQEPTEVSEPVVEVTVEPVVEEATADVSAEEFLDELDTILEGVDVSMSIVESPTVEESVDEPVGMSPFSWSGTTDDELSTRVAIAWQYLPSAMANKQTAESFGEQHGISLRIAEKLYAGIVADCTEIDEEVTVVSVADESMPSSLVVGAPAVKAPNTKVRVSRPGVKAKSTKAKKS